MIKWSNSTCCGPTSPADLRFKMNSDKLTTGEIYARYDVLLKKVEHWVASRNPHIANCDDEHVRARIVQRFVELTNEAFTQRLVLGTAGATDTGRQPGQLDLGGIKICTTTGRIKISPRLIVSNLLLFFVTWAHALLFLFISFFRNCPAKSDSATLLMEGGGIDSDDSRLVKFCRHGKITPLLDASNVIVKTRTPPQSLTDPGFFYTGHPLLFLVSKLVSRPTRLMLITRQLLTPVFYLRALFANPLNLLLGRDLAVLPVVRALDQARLIDAVIVTTSAFATQFLWMNGLSDKNFKLHMIWYSQNFIPKTYKGELQGSNLPAARMMRVDEHWVWTEGFKAYLQTLGQHSDIRVIGPILWYLPEGQRVFDNDNIKVAVFDITPVIDDKAIFGAAKNYYSQDTIKKFVADVTSVCKRLSADGGREIQVLLKHKRMPIRGRHDADYVAFLEKLEQDEAHFSMIDHRTNMFDLLAQCDISVSVPYTSTAYVSAHLKKPGIYYDPYAELVPKYESNEFVSFASGTEELEQLLVSFLAYRLNVGNDGVIER